MTMYTTSLCSPSSRWHLALVVIFSFLNITLSAATTEPAPMVIDPSQYWEGNDGPWSTFSMQIGNSKNVTRVLVSTAIPNQWVVLQEACNTTACATSRGGGLFNTQQSSTWKNTGIYNLYYENNLNYTGNGDYGMDTVGLGLNPSNASTATDQLVVGIIADDFWFGYLGINPQVTNFGNFATPVPSLIQSFRNNKAIPSVSYSYTAGAQYRNKGVFGQLILGGYDTSRFLPNNINFNMAGDDTRDLVVGIQSLQSEEANGRTTNLLNEGILAYVDSTVPWIILPDDACDTIEQTFGISQDKTTGLYLVSDSQHVALTSRNPNFTFVLGNDENGGNTVPITLPYSSFDLQVSAPYVNTSSKYFPLKRGNATTYTLGRAFLQEVYLTANYELQNFSISQALFVDGAPKSIQPIHALGYVPPNGSAGASGGTTSSASGGGLSTGAIVGIVIAAVIILIAIATLLILRHLRRWPFHNRTPMSGTELDGDGTAVGHEKDGVALIGREHPSNRKSTPFDPHSSSVEADSKDSLHGYYRPELAGTDGSAYKSELVGSGGHPTNRDELPGSNAATEVEGSPGIVMELVGSPVGQEFLRRPEGSRTLSAASNSGLGSRSTRTPRSPLARSSSNTAVSHSPISPEQRGKDVSPSIEQITPGEDIMGGRTLGLGLGLSRGPGPGSRTPVSPQSPGSQYTTPRESRTGSTHAGERI